MNIYELGKNKSRKKVGTVELDPDGNTLRIEPDELTLVVGEAVRRAAPESGDAALSAIRGWSNGYVLIAD